MATKRKRNDDHRGRLVSKQGRRSQRKNPYNSAVREWRHLLQNSLAHSTRKGYKLALDKWKNWAELADNADYMNPTLELVCSYITFLARFHKISTVKSYLQRANTAVKDEGQDLIKKSWQRVIKRTYRALP